MKTDLVDKIIIDIATCHPFSIEDVKSVYDILNSIDQTIMVCKLAVSCGYSSPLIALKAIYQPKETIIPRKYLYDSVQDGYVFFDSYNNRRLSGAEVEALLNKKAFR